MNWQMTEDYWKNENTLPDVIMDICAYVKVKASVTQSRVSLCDPMDCSPSGFSVHGISQTRILEQVAISSSRGFS